MHEVIPTDAAEPIEKVGRRSAARLRLSIPAKLTTIYCDHRCILVDLSRTGAKVALAQPLRVGEAGYLNVAGLKIFALVVWCGGGINGLHFDCALTDEQVLTVRAYSEQMERHERTAMLAEARVWVTGGH
jgi:hypothetical protein